MKKLVKKSRSPKRPLYEMVDNIPTEPCISGKISPATSFIQAMPVVEPVVIDLSGTWETPGQPVVLIKNTVSQRFEGDWGVRRLSFSVEKDMIKDAKLGTMALLCGGKVNSDGRIRWGNGQVWTRI